MKEIYLVCIKGLAGNIIFQKNCLPGNFKETSVGEGIIRLKINETEITFPKDSVILEIETIEVQEFDVEDYLK